MGISRIRRRLHLIASKVTHKPREVISMKWEDIKWADITSWSYNLFRVYEYIFGRPHGIRPEMAASTFGVVQFFTWESFFVWSESMLRQFRFPVFSIKKVYVPQLAFASNYNYGLPKPGSNYIFAIAFDATALSIEANNTGQSWSHTCTGSNGLLMVFDAAEAAAVDPYSSMTYNSVAMTAVNGIVSTVGSRYGKMWSLGNPTTGSSLTIQPTLTSQFNQGASISYSGASTTTDASNTAAGSASTSLNISVTPGTAGDNDWAVWGIHNTGGNTTAVNGTKRQSGGAPMAMGDSNATVLSSGYTQQLTFTNSNYAAVIATFSLPITTLTISAGEDITVSESVTVGVFKNISVSDSITVSESVQMNLNSFVNVFDTVTVAESLQMELDSFISVFDTVTLTESIQFEFVFFISVGEDIAITESVVMDNSLLGPISVGEDIAITESVVMDNSFLGDINVFDSVTVTESIQFEFVFFISVGEDITLTESIVMDNSPLGGINVFDAITLTESVVMDNSLLGPISVGEDITIIESVTISNSLLGGINVFDTVTVTEFIDLTLRTGDIFVIDTVTVSESVTIFITAAPIGIAWMRSKEDEYSLGMDFDPNSTSKMRDQEDGYPLGMDDTSIL